VGRDERGEDTTSYLLKTASAEHVIAAIRDAAAGTASLSPELLTRLTQALRRPPPDHLDRLGLRARVVPAWHRAIILPKEGGVHETRPSPC
jgi:DNA-binding NarL/FixJ family response regulator